jgi:hypothetical protein
MGVATLGDFSFGGALPVPSFDIQGGNPKSGLSYLLKALSEEFRFSHGVKS